MFGFGIASAASAGEVDKGAVIGGALGSGIGAGVGSKIGGTRGAIVGGGTGPAIGSITTKKEPEKVIVKERAVEKEVRVVEVHDGHLRTVGARRKDGISTAIERDAYRMPARPVSSGPFLFHANCG